MRVLYFGCIGTVGHYLYDSSSDHPRSVGRDRSVEWANHIDGLLPPRGSTGTGAEQGVASWSYLHGHTAIAFWDRSVDKRGGSSSTFLVPGFLSFDDTLKAAREAFPTIFARYKFEIVKADDVPDIA